jgi:predicted transposase YbfD/YdcC
VEAVAGDLVLSVYRTVDAQTVAAAVRNHWGIENKSHNTREVNLHKDASRIRTNPGMNSPVMMLRRKTQIRYTRHAFSLVSPHFAT